MRESNHGTFRVGDNVSVKHGWRPLSGESGTLLSIDLNDSKGAYLVQFVNGLRFRYRREELTPPVPGSRINGDFLHSIRTWLSR
jgi:hypothetical protein